MVGDEEGELDMDVRALGELDTCSVIGNAKKKKWGEEEGVSVGLIMTF